MRLRVGRLCGCLKISPFVRLWHMIKNASHVEGLPLRSSMCLWSPPCKQRRPYHHRLAGKIMLVWAISPSGPILSSVNWKNDVCYWLLICNIILKTSSWLSGAGRTSEHSSCREHLEKKQFHWQPCHWEHYGHSKHLEMMSWFCTPALMEKRQQR